MIVGDLDETHVRDVQGVVVKDQLSVQPNGLAVPESLNLACHVPDDIPHRRGRVHAGDVSAADPVLPVVGVR